MRIKALETKRFEICLFAFARVQVQAAAAELGRPRIGAAEPDEAEGFRGRASSDRAGGDDQEPQPVPDGV